ncbi:hypothetical protein ORI20_13870 [Mycobacterium sp. CVI_P3]|uniref:Exonuclease n=1 Tax=Mycobacterium pinniadriaticum TaxID=2994102 RepID=A0ABT3SE61_9MYCO|nr:hypothetical protein [Mycobacterium pinniadriaticum]MCX2931367.1 hypothetical protein [Mycobacterium pinniadriaticum]MCX2937791.1 hypothetical protein [Mycobacterium pinniadriaticum]
MTEIERDICFVDTETLGVHPDAPIWEFAAVRRIDSTLPMATEVTLEFQIQHDPADWVDTLPDEFKADYLGRYNETEAYCEKIAAQVIHTATKDTVVLGCNPGFDIERLAKLLQRNGIEPAWHYHPIDMSSFALGYLARAGVALPTSKWKSDLLSLAATNTDPARFNRHTAMGDVLWVRAQWDAAMKGTTR